MACRARACAEGVIYTIGHSNHPLADFLALLVQHGIACLVDVRAHPASRRHPQFARAALAASLEEAGIRYLWLGRELGGRGVHSVFAPERAFGDARFQRGIGTLLALAEEQRTAFMCAERDPLFCHRGLLIARYLHAQGHRVLHILADGSLEAHEETEARMLRGLGMAPGKGLFADEAQMLAEAYLLHAQRAFRR